MKIKNQNLIGKCVHRFFIGNGKAEIICVDVTTGMERIYYTEDSDMTYTIKSEKNIGSGECQEKIDDLYKPINAWIDDRSKLY